MAIHQASQSAFFSVRFHLLAAPDIDAELEWNLSGAASPFQKLAGGPKTSFPVAYARLNLTTSTCMASIGGGDQTG